MIRTRQKSKFMRNGIPGSVNPGHLTQFKRSFGQIPVREIPKNPFKPWGGMKAGRHAWWLIRYELRLSLAL